MFLAKLKSSFLIPDAIILLYGSLHFSLKVAYFNESFVLHPYKIGDLNMKKITINQTSYDFTSDFKDDASIRYGFNSLAKATFDFDFEDYYNSGYWNERYIPYALLDAGKVVANVAANILDFSVCQEMKRYIQIGTVMTDTAYRNRGLSKYLLQTVLMEWQNKSDMIYLFANDTVLDFYPKFGFTKKLQYQYKKPVIGNKAAITVLPLKMDSSEDRSLLFRLSDNTRCFSNLSAMHNTGLVMFYATSFMKDNFYYIKHLDAAVFAEYKGRTLYLNDIFSPQAISVDEVILAMAKQDTNQVVLGFTPIDTEAYTCKPYQEENDTLFVLTKDKSIFDKHKLMFPILSHS